MLQSNKKQYTKSRFFMLNMSVYLIIRLITTVVDGTDTKEGSYSKLVTTIKAAVAEDFSET